MPNTIVQIDIPEDLLIELVILTPAEAGLVSPNAAGYTVTVGAEAWQHLITVAEACIGIYRIDAQDGDGVTQGVGWVWIKDDDTETYVAENSLAAVQSSREISGIIKSGEERLLSRPGKADLPYTETRV